MKSSSNTDTGVHNNESENAAKSSVNYSAQSVVDVVSTEIDESSNVANTSNSDSSPDSDLSVAS